jgi:hypothetical protein
LAEPLGELLERDALWVVGQLAERGKRPVDADEAVLDLTNAHADWNDLAWRLL